MNKEVEKLLPEWCYVYLPSTGGLGIVKRGEAGYHKDPIFNPPSPLAPSGKAEGELLSRQKNQQLGVSLAQAAAMSAGFMFGWDVPAADPRAYNAYGQLKKSRHKETPQR